MEKILSDLIKEFEKDCKIIDLKKEYPQYQGTVKLSAGLQKMNWFRVMVRYLFSINRTSY